MAVAMDSARGATAAGPMALATTYFLRTAAVVEVTAAFVDDTAVFVR